MLEPAEALWRRARVVTAGRRASWALAVPARPCAGRRRRRGEPRAGRAGPRGRRRSRSRVPRTVGSAWRWRGRETSTSILMDMQMPIMDGYTATCRASQGEASQSRSSRLTANAMKGFERRCLEVGCTGFLTKPVDIDALVELLAGLLGGERVAGPASAPPAEPIPPEKVRAIRNAGGRDRWCPRSGGGQSPQLHERSSERFVGRLEEQARSRWQAATGTLRKFDEAREPTHTG